MTSRSRRILPQHHSTSAGSMPPIATNDLPVRKGGRKVDGCVPPRYCPCRRVVGCDPCAAHHGTLVSYDREKAWTAKAVVTEFRYVNPHAQFYFDVKGDKDHAGHWSGELLANPAQL